MRRILIFLLVLASTQVHSEYSTFKVLDVNSSVCMGFKIWVFEGKHIPITFPNTIDDMSPKGVKAKFKKDGNVVFSSYSHFHKKQSNFGLTLEVENELTNYRDIELEVEYSCNKECVSHFSTYVIPSVYAYKHIGEGECRAIDT
ncbi:hypothetical protein RI845_00240 [Thalassotalea nanhaiensis]|uniref:Uncharacterized protein n=1 Tax=Thalassotalea nanhaiensis TaxID=3065648 RepID=A0ABY9TIS0_9GAMM|nr:hypothetical protein RI845_00240 [Colwelliaceae bacterium SQ345]